jgi:uncharacterized membrane protein YdjX (TVP38/TMEM64 family)
MSVKKKAVKTVEAYWPWAIVALVLIALCFAWLLLPVDEWLKSFSDWIKSLGALGVLAFGLTYMIGTLLLAPAAAMSVAAGVAFGWWAIPLVLICGLSAATLAFLLSRYFFSDKISSVIKHRPAARATVRAINAEGWKVLLLLRLTPLVPFNAQNYLLGVTDIPLRTYVLATLVGVLPGTILSVYVGVIGTASGQGGRGIGGWILLILGLLAAIGVTVLITVKARQQLTRSGVKRK